MLRPREIAHTVVWVGRHVFGRLPVPTADLLKAYVRPNDVLLDIGAHSGNWTVALARLVPNGLVYAFEGLPYYARVLEATMGVLRRSNVMIVGKPLLDEKKTVEIVWRDRPGNRLTGRTHVKGTNESGRDAITVQSTTLDEMMPTFGGSVRFMKMDIEGAELLALRGGAELIETHRPLLYAEVDEACCSRYGHTTRDVFDFLTERGYRSYVHSDATWALVDADGYAGYGDVWFVPVEEVDTFLRPTRADRQSEIELG